MSNDHDKIKKMNSEISTLLLLGIPTATGIGSYFLTQKSLSVRGRQLILENRFNELISQGYFERTITPGLILLISMTAAIVIGKTAPVNPESLTENLTDMAALGIMCGSILGSMVSGNAKLELGYYSKIHNPDAQPRTVIDAIACDLDE